jgi:hypothetical protein
MGPGSYGGCFPRSQPMLFLPYQGSPRKLVKVKIKTTCRHSPASRRIAANYRCRGLFQNVGHLEERSKRCPLPATAALKWRRQTLVAITTARIGTGYCALTLFYGRLDGCSLSSCFRLLDFGHYFLRPVVSQLPFSLAAWAARAFCTRLSGVRVLGVSFIGIPDPAPPL